MISAVGLNITDNQVQVKIYIEGLNIVNSYYSWHSEHFYQVPHITSLMWFNVGIKNVAKSLILKLYKKPSKVINIFDTVEEKSPMQTTSDFLKKQNMFVFDVLGIRLLCPTHWTVRASALTSLSENW